MCGVAPPRKTQFSCLHCDDYFWSGISPTSLRDVLENELRARDYWTDLTLPPPIEKVMEVAEKFLNHAIYQPRNVSSQMKWEKGRKKKRDVADTESESSDDAASDSSATSSEEESSESEEDDGSDKRKKLKSKKT